MVIFLWTAVITQDTKHLGLSVIVAGDGSSVAIRTKILPGIKAETGELARTAYMHAVASRTMGLTGILDDLQVAHPCQLFNFPQVSGSSVQMDGQDCASSGSEMVLNRRSVQVESYWIDIYEDRPRTYMADSFRGGEKAVSGYDYFISRANI